ncbi:MAG: MFS transporter [Thermoplasmata archaeon]
MDNKDSSSQDTIKIKDEPTENIYPKTENTSNSDNKEIEDKLEKTRNLSIKEGSFASVAAGVGENYVTPYALSLGANNAHIGYLTSLAGLIGPISQIMGNRLIEKFERKKLIILFVALQAASWFLFIIAGTLFLKRIFPEFVVPFLIISYTIYIIFGSLAAPPWFSMMGDIVPEKIRGRYFSKRNRINGTISLIVTLGAAFWLDYSKKENIVIIGFIVLFVIASISRFISTYYFTKHYIPKIKFEKDYYFSPAQFIKKAPFNNFGRFAIFVALTHLTVNIAGPFFAVYMLKDLELNYVWFTTINMSAGLFSIIFFQLWGKFADKYGNREVLRLSSLLIPIIPMLWIFSENPLYLIFIPQLLSGIAWSGFNLASSNFIYDAVTVQRRAIVVSYYSLLNGMGIFIGAIIGGLITYYVSISFMNMFLFIFLLSGILRALVFLLIFPHVKEVRKEIIPTHRNPLLYLKEIKPIYESLNFRSTPLAGISIFKKKGSLKKETEITKKPKQESNG